MQSPKLLEPGCYETTVPAVRFQAGLVFRYHIVRKQGPVSPDTYIRKTEQVVSKRGIC